MSEKKKIKLLNKLADALNQVTKVGDEKVSFYGKPTVYDKDTDHAGSGCAIISWDGPYDWYAICGGASVYSGETGEYSVPTEAPIQKVLDEITEADFMLESINQTWIGIHNA